MARTTANNFTGALDFPVATASTDLYKKEDLQTLAQAVDQHNHEPGFGAQIGAGAVSRFSAVYGSSSSPTTTSTTAVDMPDMTLAISCPVDCLLRIDFAGTFVITVGSGYYQILLDVDGSAPSSGLTLATANTPISSFAHQSVWGYIGAIAGPHTIKARWLVSAGTTVQAYQAYRALSVLELRA